MIYQQAGLIVYNDDACLSFGYGYVLSSGGEAFGTLTETESKRDYHQIESDHAGLKRYWVWLFKHGNRGEYAISANGKAFTVCRDIEWGDGSPRQIDLLDKNGGNGTLARSTPRSSSSTSASRSHRPQPDSQGRNEEG